MSEQLFVYGSLLHTIPSQMASFLRENAHFIGEAYIKGRLYDLGAYPALRYDEEEKKEVFGHLYEIPNPPFCFMILDQYEGIHTDRPEEDEYRRAKCPVKVQGQMTEAWVYLYNFAISGKKEIKSGNYLHFLETKATQNHRDFIDSV